VRDLFFYAALLYGLHYALHTTCLFVRQSVCPVLTWKWKTLQRSNFRRGYRRRSSFEVVSRCHWSWNAEILCVHIFSKNTSIHVKPKSGWPLFCLAGRHVPLHVPALRPTLRSGPVRSPRGWTSAVLHTIRLAYECVWSVVVAWSIFSRNGLYQPTCLQPGHSPLERWAKEEIGGEKWWDLCHNFYPAWLYSHCFSDDLQSVLHVLFKVCVCCRRRFICHQS